MAYQTKKQGVTSRLLQPMRVFSSRCYDIISTSLINSQVDAGTTILVVIFLYSIRIDLSILYQPVASGLNPGQKFEQMNNLASTGACTGPAG